MLPRRPGLGLQGYFNANFLATKNLMEGCKSYGIQRFIYTSTPALSLTIKIFEMATSPYPTKTPISPYAFTKARAEQLVLESTGPENSKPLRLGPI